ncbi:MAG: hypothetical protein ACPGO3_01765 [Magnetospiraceae bacterium]
MAMAMRAGLFLLFGLMVAITPPAAAQEKYTVEDLQWLAEEQSWEELAAHLRDLRPSQRDDRWQAWAVAAGIGLLDQTAAGGDPAATFSLAQELWKQLSTLRKSPEFKAKRAAVALQFYERCYQEDKDRDGCLAGLTAFVQDYADRPETVFAAGKLSRRYIRDEYLIGLYGVVVPEANSPACADAALAKVVLATLSRNETRAPQSQVVAAQEIAFQRCWAALEKPLLAAFADDFPGAPLHARACPGLMEKGALTGMRAALCSYLAAN